MKFYLFLIFVLISTSILAKEPLPVYQISLVLNDDGSVALDRLHLTTAFNRRDFLSGPYILRLISTEGETLYIDRFDFEGTAPPKEWFDEMGKQIIFPKRSTKPTKELVTQQISKIVLNVPYIKEGKEIQIYDSDGKLALSIDLNLYCEGEGCLRKGSLLSRFLKRLGRIF